MFTPLLPLAAVFLVAAIWLWICESNTPPTLPTPYDAACYAWEAADIAFYDASDQVEAARLAGDTDRWTYWLNEERQREIQRQAAFQRMQRLKGLYARR